MYADCKAQPLSGAPQTLYVKDFGAVGDGCTDDARAIFSAILALRAAAPGSVLEFEARKTYYYKDNGTEINVLFDFKHNKGLTVRGNGCLIKLGGYKNMYADIRFCEDITLEGFHLDYAEYKPAFAAEVESFDADSATAVLIADRDINLENGECYRSTYPPLFGTLPTPYSRYYIWIDQYEMLDRAARRVRLHLKRDASEASKIHGGELSFQTTKIFTNEALYKKYGLIMPMPRCGFENEISFEIRHNTNLTMRDIDVYSNPYHALMITGSKGTFLFENVKFIRAPYDQELGFSSWGDIYHLTYNRAKFIWKNCKNEHPFDDVFNVMTGTLFVEKKHSDQELTLSALDLWYGVPDVLPGDVLTVVDQQSGMQIGRPTVASVEEMLPPAPVRLSNQEHLRIRLSEPLPGLREGRHILVWNESNMYDPASEMIDCDMDGTFRARANMTFTNCKFHVRRFWVGLEAIVEGPIPHDLLFRNCDLTGDDGSETDEDGRVWEIRSYNATEGGYHADNIVFENCIGIGYDKINKDFYDDVIIR